MSSTKVSYEGRMSYLHPAREMVEPKFPILSFSTDGFKKKFAPKPPRKRKLNGGGHTADFNRAYAELVFQFDDRHRSNIYASTYLAGVGIPMRISNELRAAGRATPIFGRPNPTIDATKNAIVQRGLADTRAMLIAAGNVLRGLIVQPIEDYPAYFVQQANALIPVNVTPRDSILAHRYINQQRRTIQGIANTQWTNRGSDNYLALIRRLNDELQDGFNQVRTIVGYRVTENPASTPRLQHRPIPRGAEDSVTYAEIDDNESMVDLDRNYDTGKYMKASTVESMPLRGEVIINPFTNAPAVTIQPYLAQLTDVAITGGRLCPICKKMIGKKH